MKMLLRSAVVLALALITCFTARAQVQPPPRPAYPVTPTVSPYLQLAGSRNPGIDYYNLVRPQIEFRNSLQGVQQQLGEALDPTRVMPVRSTGHAAYFGNYSHFFGNSPIQSGSRISYSQRPGVPFSVSATAGSAQINAPR